MLFYALRIVSERRQGSPTEGDGEWDDGWWPRFQKVDLKEIGLPY